jgi:hypothetical protein
MGRFTASQFQNSTLFSLKGEQISGPFLKFPERNPITSALYCYRAKMKLAREITHCDQAFDEIKEREGPVRLIRRVLWRHEQDKREATVD